MAVIRLAQCVTYGHIGGAENYWHGEWLDFVRTCLDTLTFDLILVKLDQKQEFLIHEKLCTPL
ncbi:hypothetical protein [Lactiplantibacillus plantarum]|uniref:hypothetical protein n=1 Tax=Lactiplantibacillus plantarum TaxID=1590 RepID=UPI0028FC211B|nr:hypothetical protein [Lactiplantibacillus plantarum]WNW20335.1 hypothetical protein RUP00_15240 [Lactiplantibacillus plantarum]